MPRQANVDLPLIPTHGGGNAETSSVLFSTVMAQQERHQSGTDNQIHNGGSLKATDGEDASSGLSSPGLNNFLMDPATITDSFVLGAADCRGPTTAVGIRVQFLTTKFANKRAEQDERMIVVGSLAQLTQGCQMVKTNGMWQYDLVLGGAATPSTVVEFSYKYAVVDSATSSHLWESSIFNCRLELDKLLDHVFVHEDKVRNHCNRFVNFVFQQDGMPLAVPVDKIDAVVQLLDDNPGMWPLPRLWTVVTSPFLCFKLFRGNLADQGLPKGMPGHNTEVNRSSWQVFKQSVERVIEDVGPGLADISFMVLCVLYLSVAIYNATSPTTPCCCDLPAPIKTSMFVFTVISTTLFALFGSFDRCISTIILNDAAARCRGAMEQNGVTRPQRIN